MAFSDLLIIGGAAWLIKEGLKKSSSDDKDELPDFVSNDTENGVSEWERSRIVNQRRKATPCFFKDGLSEEEFKDIASRVGKKLRRVKSVSVRGAVIYCTVESQTGYSNWDFNVDFNNWGHVTGTYWQQTDNDDSSIPKHYGQMVSGEIHDYLSSHSIVLEDLSDYVDANKDLETPRGLEYREKKKLISRMIGRKGNAIALGNNSSELLHEHLYPVISKLRAWGFKNIKTIPINDVNAHNNNYVFEVEQIVISGTGFFERGDHFEENVEVIITYHDKQYITMPFSEGNLKRKNYVHAGDLLVNKGYSNIYEHKIEDLVTGWLIKDGAVEKVLVDGKEETPIKKGVAYPYDTEFVIYYHTYKK